MEPQLDDYSNYCEEPGVTVNSVLLNSLGTQWPNNMESDDSEDDDCYQRRNTGPFRMTGGHW